MKLKCNCCDGLYNSIDVHFTSACDNKCAHCIDTHFQGLGISKPDVQKIAATIISHQDGMDDVLFLGGEPCLYLDALLECVRILKQETKLKLYVTTSVPRECFDKRATFEELINELDGINLSVQHYYELAADAIRQTNSTYNRQEFYNRLPYKNKIRINLNLVKPWLDTRSEIVTCLLHYDTMGFNSIKISEIQHGESVYVSFEKLFDIPMKSAYAHGCQTYLNMDDILPGFKTPVLLKRSCFLCEDSLECTLSDGVKAIAKLIKPSHNNYGVVYEDGTFTRGWV
jgi:organic radical activating enzyme